MLRLPQHAVAHNEKRHIFFHSYRDTDLHRIALLWYNTFVLVAETPTLEVFLAFGYKLILQERSL